MCVWSKKLEARYTDGCLNKPVHECHGHIGRNKFIFNKHNKVDEFSHNEQLSCSHFLVNDQLWTIPANIGKQNCLSHPFSTFKLFDFIPVNLWLWSCSSHPSSSHWEDSPYMYWHKHFVRDTVFTATTPVQSCREGRNFSMPCNVHHSYLTNCFIRYHAKCLYLGT